LAEAKAGAYARKEDRYFEAARRDIIDDLPARAEMTVLEIGCGAGATGALAKKEGRVARFVGVELDAKSAAQARRVLDEVVEGDVETMSMPFAPGSFDVLIMSEVLEHLFDPWSVLRSLAPLLVPGGLLYASSPNIAHISVLRMLLRNRWDYTEDGRMDWTHIRWFTSQTYQEMVEAAGFRTLWLRPVASMSRKQAIMNTLTAGSISHIFDSQIFIKAERI
jgi:SAM-dependent methyltransferase